MEMAATLLEGASAAVELYKKLRIEDVAAKHGPHLAYLHTTNISLLPAVYDLCNTLFGTTADAGAPARASGSMHGGSAIAAAATAGVPTVRGESNIDTVLGCVLVGLLEVMQSLNNLLLDTARAHYSKQVGALGLHF